MFLTKKQIQKRSKGLINSIRRGGAKERNALSLIYSSYNYEAYLESLISTFNIPLHQVRDVVHDSIIILRNNVKAGKVEQDINVHVYLTSIAKNILQNKNRRVKTEEIIDTNWSVYGFEELTDNYFTRKEMQEQISKLMDLIPEGCKSLLQLWQQDYTYREIATMLSLDNEGAARKRKARCFQKLVECVVEFPDLKLFVS